MSSTWKTEQDSCIGRKKLFGWLKLLKLARESIEKYWQEPWNVTETYKKDRPDAINKKITSFKSAHNRNSSGRFDLIPIEIRLNKT